MSEYNYETLESILAQMDERKPDEKDRKLIERAYDFAKHAHAGQLRASGEPYFNHVVATARNLARFGMDATTIAAGLLHDTIEDGKANEETIRENFGKDILFLVEGVTKLGKIKYRGNERRVESLRKFFVAVAEDFRVLMIKLADRLHNLQTLSYVKEEKQRRIALESLELYAPLAHRLGINKLKGELEDAAFPYAYPKEAEKIKKILGERQNLSEKYIKEAENKLCEVLKKEGVHVTKMSSRMKHNYSLWRKLERYKGEIDKIYDIMALRVIVPTIVDCYKVLGAVHSIWRPLPDRIKDYIALPKLNGYQSLHTTVFTGDGGIVEIQIRTLEMHGIAEYGVASHYAYKGGQEDVLAPKNRYSWLSDLKNIEMKSKDPAKYLEQLKMDFFKDRIFLFTPKGDVLDLPEDSSPVDFAYAVHSEVGDTMSGAKINGKLCPLSQHLKNGDIVEIITKKDAKPNPKWLDYAKTSVAKKHIRARTGEGFFTSMWNRFPKIGG